MRTFRPGAFLHAAPVRRPPAARGLCRLRDPGRGGRTGELRWVFRHVRPAAPTAGAFGLAFRRTTGGFLCRPNAGVGGSSGRGFTACGRGLHFLPRGYRRLNKYQVIPYERSGRSNAWDFHLPADILRLAPGGGRDRQRARGRSAKDPAIGANSHSGLPRLRPRRRTGRQISLQPAQTSNDLLLHSFPFLLYGILRPGLRPGALSTRGSTLWFPCRFFNLSFLLDLSTSETSGHCRASASSSTLRILSKDFRTSM